MKIIGLRSSSFTGQDGKMVNGLNIYMTGPLEKGEGLEAVRVFVSVDKASSWLYRPKVGDEVEIIYNRYGKCQEIVQLGGGK
ncbi:MAG: hypothetical protein [Inoviridae sp.]|nr:MAG: hypothetical protein [Inoviridae sp.]